MRSTHRQLATDWYRDSLAPSPLVPDGDVRLHDREKTLDDAIVTVARSLRISKAAASEIEWHSPTCPGYLSISNEFSQVCHLGVSFKSFGSVMVASPAVTRLLEKGGVERAAVEFDDVAALVASSWDPCRQDSAHLDMHESGAVVISFT
jgi:hypothetical protein